jgi:DNA (cytosine-5)-methyltransferase 1
MLANGGGKSAEWTAHPEGKRLITIGELLRLSSFPDDFVVTGIYVKQFERIGRAVPPLVSRAIATKIREAIL